MFNVNQFLNDNLNRPIKLLAFAFIASVMYGTLWFGFYDYLESFIEGGFKLHQHLLVSFQGGWFTLAMHVVIGEKSYDREKEERREMRILVFRYMRGK